MSLEHGLPSQVWEDRIRLEKFGDNDIDVLIKRNGEYTRVLRIYPLGKFAEFLDIDDQWDELDGALESDYGEFPELLEIAHYLKREKYDIIF